MAFLNEDRVKDSARKGERGGEVTYAGREEGNSEDYEMLRHMYDDSMRNLQEGEIIRGRVIHISENEVVVDIGYKSEGIIQLNEFRDLEGKLRVAVGDEVDVLLEKTEDTEGHVILSKEKAEKMRVWDDVERAFREGKVIKGRVIDRIKGGLAVDIGVKAFLPGSLIDVKPVKNLDSFKGRELEVKVISVDKKRGNIVLSRRAVVEVEYEKRKKTTLLNLEEGRSISGTVKNITDYGVFVDLGGIDGLLHITDISWGRVAHPGEIFQVGQDIEVKIIKFDRENERVSLGYKQKTDDPWITVPIKYPVGTRVSGKVVNLTDYGAFVELETGVEGLIHVSEMSWTKKVKNPAKLLNVGDMVEAVVSDINSENRRISLSLKQTERNPWDLVREKYQEGSRIVGKVRNITDFGAFVEVEEGVDGLIHISDMSWTKRVRHPQDVLKRGDSVEAIITHIDAENRRLSLSIKEFMPNEWDEFAAKRVVGDVSLGRVVKIADFGMFVDLGDGIEGLVHVSEVDKARNQKLDAIFKVGDRVMARIIKLDWDEKKIGLSMKDVPQEFEDEDPAASELDSTADPAMAVGAEPQVAPNASPVGTELQDSPGASSAGTETPTSSVVAPKTEVEES